MFERARSIRLRERLTVRRGRDAQGHTQYNWKSLHAFLRSLSSTRILPVTPTVLGCPVYSRRPPVPTRRSPEIWRWRFARKRTRFGSVRGATWPPDSLLV